MRALALLLLGGCATSTGGALVELPARVSGTGQGRFAVGAWEVRLERADIAVGPIYLWSDLPRSADEEAAGLIIGEVPHRVILDATTDDVLEPEPGHARADEVRSAEIWLEPVSGGDTVEVVGEAERDGETYPFAAAITWESPWVDEENGRNALLRRRVRGLPVEGQPGEDSVLSVVVDASAWFSEAGLDALPELTPDEAGVRVLTPDSLTGRDLDQGIRRTATGESWTITLE